MDKELDRMLWQAGGFYAMGQYKMAEATCAAIERGWGRCAELHVQEAVAAALLLKGSALSAMHEDAKAFAAYADLARRAGEPPSVTMQRQVALALLNQTVILSGGTGGNAEAIPLCDEIARRIGASRDKELRVMLSDALLIKAMTLNSLGRRGEMLAVCNELTRRFRWSLNRRIRGSVAFAKDMVKLAGRRQVP